GRLLKIVGAEKVLDLTYGRGSFYFYYRPKELWGIDIHRHDWLVAPDKFIQKDVEQLSDVASINELPRGYFDAVVVDPPYSTHRVVTRHDLLYAGDCHTVLANTPRIARHVLRKGGFVIVKIMDAKKRGKLRYECSHFEAYQLFTEQGFALRDVIIWRFFVKRRPVNSGNKVLTTHTYVMLFA
ncbi:MAG: hypothetical protein JZD41_05630, partial [Thermoproteus sp.]|nr:hypothetical protein [Thermoproteus sp.]